jgi:hypothetical protein
MLCIFYTHTLPVSFIHYYFFQYTTPSYKKHEPSKLNYYTFGDELTILGINSLSPPSKWMLYTKNYHSTLDEKLSTQDQI